MARHSHWANIKHQKAATDRVRGKIFTKHARLIMTAARNGVDPDTNSALAAAIADARADSVPNENIERAIQKGLSGGSGEGYEQIIYEGFGPGGVAFLIVCLTDNKNRAVANVRHIMNKHGGQIGQSGSVGYLFSQKGVIEIAAGDNAEEIELSAIDAGAEDIIAEAGHLTIITPLTSFAQTFAQLQKFAVQNKGLKFIPHTMKLINDHEIWVSLLSLNDALEADDDVSEVFNNMEPGKDIAV